MGFISNAEIKDRCIGHYGILFKATPVDEGTLTKGSVIFVNDLYDENIYSVKEFEQEKNLKFIKIFLKLTLLCQTS